MEPLGIISVTITLFAVVLPRLAKEIVYVIGCPTSAIVKSTSLTITTFAKLICVLTVLLTDVSIVGGSPGFRIKLYCVLDEFNVGFCVGKEVTVT
ncbi:hypothetical protein BACERE00193_05479 [Bacillus paranthracis]|uniref:Uncharacterized protein n=1 Tax=Bacillus paranthracis TaxID=2026186 RepID=A0A7D8H342_9BACI|nr:hypothetical protein BMB171_C1436 [Bacillus thuringiensis BMB171]KZD83128.1 hypothetical protein B4155_2230 [Bacillus cereus]COL85989.1 Uncharacterised protein [Streptococcus pneumoniae]SMD60839.1 hypothetical protein BACERE00174_00276 [Bacillus paranthracis]SMD59323.1 hypothetical protein BACERE00184_00028 [Bacillus cereus]